MAQIIDKFGLIADKKKQNERKDICKPCEFMKMKWGMAFCEDCGCHVSSKVMLKSSECPQGKW
tara:strand:+ start:854 stop:1042 length:189 start_codon:yes stop_codon:yes gene_type:complete